ncbi:MAG TPA: SDR family oxidoreductase [Candidatus Sulfotelmatobacter sp.]|nr:SDR family oxidoreductase [Candidatus Sulfotelmatobacter sp.]
MATGNDAQRKVVIVTGASRGIGAGLVQAFRDLGYAVVANARAIEPSTDPDVLTIAGDISLRATASDIVERALRRFGRIDTLINNAGAFMSKPFTEYQDADFADLVATNLGGFFHVTQAAIVPMLEQRAGHVVNMAASVADHPSSRVPAVLTSLTKGGLTAATRALALEYAARGIRVNAVSPSATNSAKQAVPVQTPATTLQPLGRMAEIADVVGAVLYLESAPFVTGEILHVDGGESAGQ